MADDFIGKIPPQSVDSERGMLGSVLIDTDAFIKVVDMLSSKDFYDTRHRYIYQAMLDLFYTHKPIDLVTITQKLKDSNHLEDVGGGSYLSELMDEVPTSSHIVQYAKTVKDKSTLRSLIKSGQDITALGYEEEKEVSEVVEGAEKNLYGVTHDYIKENFVHIREIVEGIYDKASEVHEAGGDITPRGIPSHFRDLDVKLWGFQPADLLIIAARPSMGKTAFVLNLAQNMSRKGNASVGIFSLEMAKEQLVERMFCSILQIDSWKLRTGQLSDDDFPRMAQAIDDLGKTPIYIDDVADCTVTDIRAKARRLQMEHGLDAIMVDYLQLMRGNNPFNRVQELSDITRGFKALARELGVPVIVLSQLSRAVEQRADKEPNLSDLRESGSIEQDADVVMMLYREQYYDPESQNENLKVLIRKHRNGPIGDVEIGFDLARQTMFNLDREHVE